MNIETNTTISTVQAGTTNKVNSTQNQAETNFAEELDTLSKNSQTQEQIDDKVVGNIELEETHDHEKPENINNINKIVTQENVEQTDPNIINNVIDGLKNTVEEINQLQTKSNNQCSINQPDDNFNDEVKEIYFFDDKEVRNEDDNLINNDINIPEPQKEILMQQMNAGMNFNSQNQPFSEFIQNNTEQKLNITDADLEEEKAILSTMDENIAIANKNILISKKNQQEVTDEAEVSRVKTVVNDEGIKKVDTKTQITVEKVISYDNVIMSKEDVEFFSQLVENEVVEMDSQSAIKSSKVSKTLADLIAKSMQDNKPVRIDFDNNISVIIKISRDGKITADFLPSSQVAEAYLKENLPLLRQRFDDNNIDYESLNQRKQKQEDKNNQKKERKHE